MLNRANFEEVDDVYAPAAIAQIGKARGSGASVIRFTSGYINAEHCEFVIFAVGQKCSMRECAKPFSR